MLPGHFISIVRLGPLSPRTPSAHRYARVVLLLVLGWAIRGPSLAWAAKADDALAQARAQLETEYRQRLDQLAQWCDEHRLPDQAAETRQWARPLDHLKLYVIGEFDNLPTAREEAGKSAAEWAARFAALRNEQAEALYALSRQAIRAQRASLAFELVLEALRANPDHADARRLLGYTRYKGQWRTPFEKSKLKAGQVWSERFGWLPKAHLARYEKGERYFNGRWISAEEEARAHADIRTPWRVETEHYAILTNHSLEAGVQLGRRLERLYRAWQQTFTAYFASPDQLIKLFEGRGLGRAGGPRHLVVYYRSRDEYRQALAGHIPPDVVTTGIYLGDRRTAFFYAAEENDHSTLYHEASHQLFSETRDVAPVIGGQANFWIVEGIACYLESFEEHAGYDTLGGAEAQRLEDARVRLLRDSFYVPLAELTTYNMNDLQHDPRIAMLYSQSAGLAHFLMHADQGRYRDALIEYLATVYSGDDAPATLSQLTGRTYAELDRDYRRFLETTIPVEPAESAPRAAASTQAPMK